MLSANTRWAKAIWAAVRAGLDPAEVERVLRDYAENKHRLGCGRAEARRAVRRYVAGWRYGIPDDDLAELRAEEAAELVLDEERAAARLCRAAPVR